MIGLCSGMSRASEFQAQLKTCSLRSWQLVNAGCQHWWMLGASLRLWLESLHVLPVSARRKERKPYCLVRPGLRNSHYYVRLPALRQKVLPQFIRQYWVSFLEGVLKWRYVYVICNGVVIWGKHMHSVTYAREGNGTEKPGPGLLQQFEFSHVPQLL